MSLIGDQARPWPRGRSEATHGYGIGRAVEWLEVTGWRMSAAPADLIVTTIR
jgi:hypothetical protein